MKKLLLPAMVLLLFMGCNKETQTIIKPQSTVGNAHAKAVFDDDNPPPIDSAYQAALDSIQNLIIKLYWNNIEYEGNVVYRGSGTGPVPPVGNIPNNLPEPIVAKTKAAKGLTWNGFAQLPEGGCGEDGAYYTNGISAGGLFGSSFSIQYTLNNRMVGNFTMNLVGFHPSWDWSTNFTYFDAGGYSGTTFGTADYSYGSIFGFSHTYDFQVQWRVDMEHCKMYFYFKQV